MVDSEFDKRLLRSVRQCQTVSVLECLAKGANPDSSDEEGCTALMWAMYCNDDQIARALIAGAHPNASDHNGQTALMIAAERGNTDFIEILLTAGADPNARDKDDETALMMAAKFGRVPIIKRLVAAGADVNSRDQNGYTALMWAALRIHDAETLLELTNVGADVNLQDNYRRSAAMHAAWMGHRRILEALITAGADLRLRDRGGADVVDLARETGQSEIEKFLSKLLSEGEVLDTQPRD